MTGKEIQKAHDTIATLTAERATRCLHVNVRTRDVVNAEKEGWLAERECRDCGLIYHARIDRETAVRFLKRRQRR
jgi:hypothetical protein